MKASLELNSRPNRNGLYDIFVRIQDGNQRSRKKTTYAVKKNHFDSKKTGAWISTKDSNYAAMNKNLATLLEKYTNQIAEGQNINSNLETTDVFTGIKNKDKTATFVAFYKSMSTEEMMPNYNQRKGYDGVLSNWFQFIDETNMSENLTFQQMKVSDLVKFEKWLFKRGLQSSSVHSNLKRIKACFNSAKKDKLIKPEENLFEFYKLPSPKPAKPKVKLTPAELLKFLTFEYPDGTLTKTVQKLFQIAYCLQGARIEDVLTLAWSDIKDEQGIVSFVMKKNGKPVNTPFTETLMDALSYFRSIRKGKNPLVIPILEPAFLTLKFSSNTEENENYKREIGKKTSLVNKYIKKIAADCEITKKVSTHGARHAVLNNAIRVTGGDAKKVKGIARHSTLVVTDNYVANDSEESISEIMDKVTSLENLEKLAKEDLKKIEALQRKLDAIRNKLKPSKKP